MSSWYLGRKSEGVIINGMKFWKWFLLIVLSIQNAFLILLISKFNKSGNSLFLKPSLMVCWVEIVKLLFCLGLEIFAGDGLEGIFSESLHNVAWLALPAFLYAIQNNLCHIALRHLSPLIYQILYQSKILTTAGFSVLLLGKRLSQLHWASLSLLLVGIVLVQMRNADRDPKASLRADWHGLMALGFAALSSGFSGVFFERIVKIQKRKRSVWLQSIYLCLFALPISASLAIIKGDTQNALSLVPRHRLEVFLILLQALSGLLVALIIRHLDNILKTFATGASIILCVLFDNSPELAGDKSLKFWIGSFFVLLAVYFYGRAENLPPQKFKMPAKFKRVESARND
jgi:solute carrier family 35 (UDP-sugar transporter), member A1/2/3